MTLALSEFWFTDSIEKYYLLGHLFADGNIAVSGGVTIASRDIEYMKMISKLIARKINTHIESRSNKEIAVICYGGIKLAEYLIKYGLMPKKSRVMQFPVDIPEEYMRDFIRGYFDGDGCITIRRDKRRGKKYSISFSSGSWDFLQSLSDITQKCIGISGRKRYQKTEWGECYSLYYDGATRFRVFRDYLYYNECFCLKRKREKFFSVS